MRCALLLLLTLRGTPLLYYGDELGMQQAEVTGDAVRDPANRRDGARTPMQWTGAAGAGFTGEGVEPWLPFGDAAKRNVEAQRGDPDSHLRLVRDLVALRRDRVELRAGSYESLPSPSGSWAWRRGGATVIGVNLSDAEVAVDGVDGRIAIATDRSRDGEAVVGALRLARAGEARAGGRAGGGAGLLRHPQ